MKTSEYWQKRFQAVEAMNNKTAKNTIQAVTPAFDQAQAQIEKEINAWYARFAKNNQIDLQEAKKLLNTKELKEFRWDVEEYIKYGRQNAIDQQWMKQLENASARFHISRLEALKIRTQNAAERAFGNELDQIDQMAARVYMDDYYHTAYEIQKGLGIGWDVAQIDQKKLDKILSKPWTADKMTFSDRIWKSKTQLIDSLHKELTQMCVLGKAPDQAISNIAKRMNVSKGQAGRLIMTESAYFGSAAQKDCFNDLDVEKFEVVATLDNRTSPTCQEMDGKVFDTKDFQAGVTAPPFHVWCRSCTAPWFEDNDDGMRAARDADGKTYQVPASMKYDDWKAYFVDKTKDPVDFLKPVTINNIEKILNRDGKEIIFDGKFTDEQINIIRNLSSEYNTRLERVIRGAEKAAGDVDISSSRMRLNGKSNITPIHEFAHTLTNSRGTKYGIFTDEDDAFWKEIRKVRNQYMKAVGEDSSRWISWYEHSSGSLDEFVAEAFTQVKLKQFGLPIPDIYGKDFTYSEKVVEIIDKYFRKVDLAEEVKEIRKAIKLEPDMFPPSFTATKPEAKNTQALMDYVNACENADPDVIELYSKMGKMENIESKGFPFAVKHNKNSAVGYRYRLSDGKLAEASISYPKLTGDNFAGRVQTTLHEQMHLMDMYCRKDIDFPSGWFSSEQDDFVKIFKDITDPKDVKMSDAVKKLFADYKVEYDNIHDRLYKEYRATSQKLSDQYWKTHEITASEYKKALKKAEKIYDEGLDYQCRNAANGLNNFQDIYDALSGGNFRDNGVVKYGHGSSYYRSIEKRCHETLANYGALSITRPDLIDLLREDNPELVDELEKIVKKMLEKVGE